MALTVAASFYKTLTQLNGKFINAVLLAINGMASAGTGLTVNITAASGVPATIAINVAGTGYATGQLFSITQSSGYCVRDFGSSWPARDADWVCSQSRSWRRLGRDRTSGRYQLLYRSGWQWGNIRVDHSLLWEAMNYGTLQGEPSHRS